MVRLATSQRVSVFLNGVVGLRDCFGMVDAIVGRVTSLAGVSEFVGDQTVATRRARAVVARMKINILANGDGAGLERCGDGCGVGMDSHTGIIGRLLASRITARASTATRAAVEHAAGRKRRPSGRSSAQIHGRRALGRPRRLGKISAKSRHEAIFSDVSF